MKKQRNILTLPDRFWNSIDNTIDGELIRTRGDALIHLLLELEKANPKAICFEEMIYIRQSEYQNLKNELNNIKTSQINEKVLSILNDAIEGEILKMSENTAMIIASEIKTNKSLSEKFKDQRKEISTLKQRIAELEANR